MTEVFLLWEVESYEPNRLISIHSDLQGAEQALSKAQKYLDENEISFKILYIEKRKMKS